MRIPPAFGFIGLSSLGGSFAYLIAKFTFDWSPHATEVDKLFGLILALVVVSTGVISGAELAAHLEDKPRGRDEIKP